MADAQPTQNAEQPATQEAAGAKPAAGASGNKVWIIAAAIAVVSAGTGFGISKLSANSSANMFKPSSAEPAKKEAAEPKPAHKVEPGKEGGTWYFKLDPVVANLDEPGALRYIRVAIYIELEGAESEESKKEMDEKKPMLINWLQLYLAGRSLEEAKGEKNLKAMQAHILEGFNQIMFPNEKSLIKGVLFGEINIQ